MATEADLYALAPDNVFKPVTADNPLHIAGSFSATISGFAPNGNAGTPIAVTGTTSATVLPAGEVVVFSNVGSVTAFLKLGDSGVSVDNTGLPIFASGQFALTVGVNTYAAAITSSGTTTINMTGGAGLYA